MRVLVAYGKNVFNLLPLPFLMPWYVGDSPLVLEAHVGGTGEREPPIKHGGGWMNI